MLGRIYALRIVNHHLFLVYHFEAYQRSIMTAQQYQQVLIQSSSHFILGQSAAAIDQELAPLMHINFHRL